MQNQRPRISLALAGSAFIWVASAAGGQICPLPVPPELPLCQLFQPSQCIGNDAQICLPEIVFIDAFGFPQAEVCVCFPPGPCGPVHVFPTPIPEDFILSCEDPCPPGMECQVFVNGAPTGQTQVNSLGLPPGSTVTCDCAELLCPLPDPPAVDPCAVLQATDCTNPETAADLCLLSCVNFDPDNGAVTALECDCRQTDECHVLFEPGVEPTCIGGCPPGEICLETITDNPSIGGIDICCDCVAVLGACCFDIDDGPLVYDSCTITDPASCEEGGGFFQGPGTVCTLEACCLSDGFCQDADPECCVASGGVPQGPGSICLGDANGNGIDDACEPPPPLCPEPVGQDFCAALQQSDCIADAADQFCLPKVVAVDITGILVELCDCFGPQPACGPVVIEGDILACPGPCPVPPGGECQVFINGDPTGEPSVDIGAVPLGSVITCECAEIIPLCPLPTPPLPEVCAPLQPIDCTDPDTAAELCLPSCVNFDPDSGAVTALECDCRLLDECHVQVDSAGGLPTCAGGCPPSEICVETMVANPDIGGIDICCNCLPPPGACCYDADGDTIPESCAEISPAQCAVFGGIFHGPGSTCLGVGACCFGVIGGACVEIDKICCPDILGFSHGVGSICLGDTDGNAVDDRCQCPADLNGDGVINAADLALLLGSWGPCPCCPADLNGDGVINAADLALLLGSWAPCP